jgi:radical SAM protein with 4Fe4S-binding SPASM domain
MSRNDHFKAVDKFIRIGVMAFDFAGGGEPTLIPYIDELIEYIGMRGCHSGLITNGSNLDDALITAILKNSTYVRISLEASDRQSYLNYKGVDSWHLVLENVLELTKRKEREKSKCQISLKFSVGKSLRGREHFAAMFDVCQLLKVDRVSIKFLRHEPEELCEVDKWRQQSIYMSCRPTSHAYQIFDSLHVWKESEIPQCYLNPLHTVMDDKGNIYICCYYYYRGNDFLIGNILTDKFPDIWYSDLHRKKITEINKKHCAKVDCKFFAHHKAAESALSKGQVYFL